MTPLEILGAAINGTPAPRIPIFAICSIKVETVGHACQISARPVRRQEAQLKLLERYGHDNV